MCDIALGVISCEGVRWGCLQSLIACSRQRLLRRRVSALPFANQIVLNVTGQSFCQASVGRGTGMARACLHPRIAPWLVHGAIFWRTKRQRDKSNKPGTIGGGPVDDMPATLPWPLFSSAHYLRYGPICTSCIHILQTFVN